MTSQFAPLLPRSPHASSNRDPTIELVFVVCGVKRQLKDLEVTQLQTSSFGVGGKVVEAKKVEFCEGHVG
jgi:hypothetical protein